VEPEDESRERGDEGGNDSPSADAGGARG